MIDNGNDNEGFRDGNVTGDDYIYDDNGNMITDKNKDIATIDYNHLNLPAKVIKADGQYIKYIYNAAGVKLSQQVYDALNVEKKRTDYVGEFFYENDTLKFINHEEGRIVMTGEEPEYQYTLKDHLGNSRITFTTKFEAEDFNATLDTQNQSQEQSQFGAYNSFTNQALDPTPSSSENDKILILNGGYAGRIGLTKTLSVVPGDIIYADVRAKFSTDAGQGTDLGNIAVALTEAFNLTPGLPGEAGTAFQALTGIGSWIATGGREDNDNDPKGFITIIVFDKEYNLVDISFEQTAAGNVTLSAEAYIRQPGYAYIFVSNEGANERQIGFDDYGITIEHSPVIQQDDYYPFGLTFNSYSRENNTPNLYLYNSMEMQDELNLEWYDYGARMYDPAIARWMAIDPLSDVARRWSPYVYCYDNPMRFIDPDGMKAEGWIEDDKGNVTWDPNTNSQEEFDKNYEGKDGYSYVSDADNPDSYTLPNGDGKLEVKNWTEYESGSVSIDLEFKPSEQGAEAGWFQTFDSNIPDFSEETIDTDLPQANSEERIDGANGITADATKASYMNDPPRTTMGDSPVRRVNTGAERPVTFNAQTSMIVNGQKSFSVGWGFAKDRNGSVSVSRPTILKSNTSFHDSAIQYLKFNK